MNRMKLFVAQTLAFTSLAASVAQSPAQRSWQQLNFPDWRAVSTQWKTPPSQYGPEPYYGLNGNVTLEDVRRDLDTMKRLGFHGVTVQYGYGSNVGYLSREYFDFFRQFVAEAKRRDIHIWIVDDAGYPSGFAGGKFTTEHPELRMQALAASQPQTLRAGETYDRAVSPAVVAVTAINPTGETLQIPITQGHAQWVAPAGEWTVYAVEHIFRTSPTRSDTNPQRVKDGSQSLEDYLDPAATQQYLSFTHEQYRQAVGDEFGKTILGFRGDEPDYSISGLPWTPKFFAAFEAKKGYDIRPHLATFLQVKGTKLTPNQRLAKADYYDVFADLFRDGFFKPQADWCAANGLEYQVHLNHEERELDLTRSEGEFFRDMRYVQIPGVDSIWHQIWTDTISDFPRLASSAAHVYGHPRSMTETFAAYRPEPDLPMARYILNEQFVRGINLIETMYFPASVAGKGGPGRLMREPGFPDLMQYSARLSFLMSQGHPAAQVALLLPAASLWMESAVTDDAFVSTERLLSEHQVDFDVVDEDAIRSLLKLDGGAFLSGSGNHYRTLLVPNAIVLSTATLDRLKQFSAAGGKVVFLGAPPTLVAARSYLKAEPAGKTQLSFAAMVSGQLPAVPTPPAQPPASAPEPMAMPAGFWDGVQKNLPQQVLTMQTPTTQLRVAQRLLHDASIVLLFNESSAAFADVAAVHRARIKSVDVLDIETGEVHPLQTTRTANGVQVKLQLPAYGTQVLLLR